MSEFQINIAFQSAQVALAALALWVGWLSWLQNRSPKTPKPPRGERARPLSLTHTWPEADTDAGSAS